MEASLLYMLHAQHRYYMAELADTHRRLGIQYNKIAKAELDLLHRHEKDLTRQDKKRLQWTRCQAKTTVKDLWLQQTWLHDYLRQCNDLIASCEASVYATPVTPWSALSPNDPFSPVSGFASPMPWPTPFQPRRTPQYWDLSMLRESSPFAASWSADSGYHEALNDPLPLETTHHFRNPLSTNDGDDEVEAAPAAVRSPSPLPSKKSSTSEKDDVPELLEPTTGPIAAPVSPGAHTHKRRFSENAIQLIESRLTATPGAKQTCHQHRRGYSASATPVPQRRVSVHPAIA